MDYNEYLKSKNNNEDKKFKYLKNLITRTLFCIILVLIAVIAIKVNNNYKDIINKYLFTDNFSFNKVNKYLGNNLGTIVPVVKTSDTLVFSSKELKNKEYEIINDYALIKLDKNTPISSLCGGIVVFMGEKEGYGQSVVVEQINGIDVLYSNIESKNIKLYDYVEKGSLVGESNGESINIKIVKDGKSISYAEYIK